MHTGGACSQLPQQQEPRTPQEERRSQAFSLRFPEAQWKYHACCRNHLPRDRINYRPQILQRQSWLLPSWDVGLLASERRVWTNGK